MKRYDDWFDLGLVVLLGLMALRSSDPAARAAYVSAVVVIGVLR